MITILSKRFTHLHAGGSSRYVFDGVAQFNLTDTTGEIAIPDIRTIRNWSFGLAGPGTGAQQPSLDETVAADGGVSVPSPTRSVTVTRAVGTTSGLKFAFHFEG